MSSALTIRAALARGAVVALANWPVVLIEFVVESAYKALMGVPIVGGAFMVAVLVGADMQSLLREDLLSAADQILVPLISAPAALAAFLGALSMAGVAGAVLMFVVKSGTLAVLVAGDKAAGEIDHHHAALGSIKEARAYSLQAVWDGIRRFERRAAILALWLGVVYVGLGGLYLFTVVYGFQWVAESPWAAAWPLLVVIATSAAVIGVTAANLLFDLVRVVIVTEDCRVSEACRRVKVFLLEDARQVLGIFGVMGTILLLATAASITATAGLTMIAWVPLAGLLVVPLQVAFWILRGLLFQYMGLTTLSAYQTQYRRFSAPRAEPVQLRVHGA